MKFPIRLFATALLAHALALASAGDLVTVAGEGGDAPAPRASLPPRVECAPPARLRLHRFEDGSARLDCGARTLVRVSVPG